MKLPAVLMASLLAAGVSAQTKPVSKNKKQVKKMKKEIILDTSKKPKPTPKVIVKKDTLIRVPHHCPACGMG
ncbi:hypothetical protein HX13_12140 [Chryseobacterium sp. P1-3]|uniref:Uncharacterized protein n=1 Tax=Chryseobacterium gallinarum TaxID=1324352 RepID=A0A0G3M5Y8_CHRGL|nr:MULTISPECIES: hypothetical protein [Chryseobacterium]AKK73995.1 hypothetical protein OK18_16535 [Chryseobacterium gallinarum]KFF74770.1 hypothetical protein HX13_12140 [Chryseobacterium sp. P1-3]MCL8537802.1 hypothetical protein [Chryseobacterium gallinarum]QIY90204.1 hypothetical protein FOB44_05810 [Chryseobacterium gallinarum]